LVRAPASPVGPPEGGREAAGTGSAAMAHIPTSMPLEKLEQILPQLVDQGLPDNGEFLIADLNSSERTHSLIALLIWHGYLPMGGMGMLLPKIHKERCILPPREVHVGKKVRKRAKGFHISVNQEWSTVVRRIQDSKDDCWLSNDVAAAYQAVEKVSGRWRRGDVRFHSIELWHTASNELVAGEIGYTCGRVYSSCTGFTRKEDYPGAGNVQLAALGRWLDRCGFELWDLGMELDYKKELGGKMVSRSVWAKTIRALRGVRAELANPGAEEAPVQRLLAEPAAGDAEAQPARQPPKKSGATSRSPMAQEPATSNVVTV